MTDYTTGQMINMKLSLLGTELNAGVLHGDDGTRFYILQDADLPVSEIEISQLISDVRSLMNAKEGDEVEGLESDKISEVLSKSIDPGKDPADPNKAVPFDVKSIKIKMQTVYLNIFVPKVGKATYQYAFRVELNLGAFLPKDVQSIKVHSLSLAIWHLDTKNDAIRKRLAIPDLSEKLDIAK
ncbi:MAG: hypothetical protein IPK50_19440 [Fibrobacterota bacterium]|nr:hypothetical protein [Fibrobacterota bacterium]QQS04440.1 MAG: hypothetical protein IPK50_19440 [Fibrobacterota bacterium]